jgi:hypothetical protein
MKEFRVKTAPLNESLPTSRQEQAAMMPPRRINPFDVPPEVWTPLELNQPLGTPLLPSTATERKAVPLASGVLDYFPAALAAVAEVSKLGNDQHNPGEPIHWARGKSMDQADCLIRHFLERGTNDCDGVPHSAKMAWRALALLQLELEEAGAPIARGAK